MYRLLIALTGLLVFGVVACGDDDDDDPSPTPVGEQGQAGLCADLVLVNTSLNKVLAINASTTVGQAEAMRDELNLSLTEMQEAGEELTTAQSAKLQDTFQDFDADVDELAQGNVSKTQTLGPEAAPLQARGQAIDGAVTEVEASSGCPG